MSVWTTMARWLGMAAIEETGLVKARPRNESAPAWLTATAAVDVWRDDPEGAERQTALYRKLSWVQLAIGTVARAVAGVPLHVQRLGADEGKQEIDNHPFEQLLRRPNPRMSRFELLESIVSYRALTGNAYLWMNRLNPSAPPTELWVLPAQRVRPLSDGRMGVRGFAYDPGDGTAIPLEPWEVMHFSLFHPDNVLQGLSPLESLASIAKGDLAMQRWNTNFFAENNAKSPGALAFSDPIDDASWEAMKADIRSEHGGVRRNLMMLRNAGPGGVQWIGMNMSQRDMEFLSARTFNKEEILAMYAPGLASMLAVNATEANSLAGKATFLEFAVWPTLVALAEKISNDVLPAYGDSLVANFEDVRIVDRAMQLQEQAAFAAVHTLDEVRAKFYQDPPIGDERGLMLATQASAAPPSREPTDDNPPDEEDDDEPMKREARPGDKGATFRDYP